VLAVDRRSIVKGTKTVSGRLPIYRVFTSDRSPIYP